MTVPMLDGSSCSSAVASVAAILSVSVDVYRDALRATPTPTMWLDIDACFDAVLDGLARLEPDIRDRVDALPETLPCVCTAS